MNFLNYQHSQNLYTDSPVPHFTAQPFKVYSTPGLGNFFNDHALYTHVRYFEPNIKEVEKEIEKTTHPEGGLELNSPLIPESLLTSKKKKKKRKSGFSGQKGQGSENDQDIEEAFQHPIKVVCLVSNMASISYHL